ncbi:hypothetical protein [Halosolutus gelatinilyticus]|uniref:hypothetical protein n=1 Tax=Halosolutus gelatinilyticus TaxID=2931975 RepID=UPI001FF0DFB7|nr:hypothetical protein [Halosolutus gelatinilyticus]
MTDNNERLIDRLASTESRRSFLEKSAIATVGVSAASGVASAQDDDDDDDIGEDLGAGTRKASIFQNDFRPEARFSFVSGVIDWNPNYGGIDGSWFTDYNTRTIRWFNTGEHVQLFVASDAELGRYDDDLGFVVDDDDRNRPQVYEMSPEWTLFEGDPKLVTVEFGPVEEEIENQLLEADTWWTDQRDAAATGGNGGNVTTDSTNTTRGD